jgi:hypothetical protein
MKLASEEGQLESTLTDRTRIVLTASLSVSVYPMIATIVNRRTREVNVEYDSYGAEMFAEIDRRMGMGGGVLC